MLCLKQILHIVYEHTKYTRYKVRNLERRENMNKKVWELVVKKYKTRQNIENFLIDLAVNTTILVTSLIIIYIVYRLK